MDEKALLEAIGHMMDSKLDVLEKRMDEKLAAQHQETIHAMNVLIETKVHKELTLIQENQQLMMDKLGVKVDREEFEDRVTTLEGSLRIHTREIAELKKAN